MRSALAARRRQRAREKSNRFVGARAERGGVLRASPEGFGQSRRHHFSGYYAASRDSFFAQQRGLRQEIPAGDDGPRSGVHRLRQRWLARYFSGERHRLARATSETQHAEAISQQPRR